jgi:predicted Fe-Mo cluster-binding NifX family protein
MKICIPTNDDRGLESELCTHFGSAPFFVVTNAEHPVPKVVQNPQCHDHAGSCHHVPLLASHGIDAVVCGGMGRRAVSGLREAGIDVLVTSGRTVSQIVDAVNAGETRPLSADDACGGGRGHGHGAGHGHGCGHGHGHGPRQG